MKPIVRSATPLPGCHKFGWVTAPLMVGFAIELRNPSCPKEC
jgi:hypothetical protein